MTWLEIVNEVELPIEESGGETPRSSVKLQNRCRRRKSESGLGGKLPVRKGDNPDRG